MYIVYNAKGITDFVQNEVIMKQRVIIRGMAKVNLALDVLGRRENGYHDVRMIMQTVNLYDKLTLEKLEGKEIQIACNTGELPLDDSNLIFKAARLFFEAYETAEGVFVNLEKNIPIAAGMAGGSTDAAATLIALNEMFDAGFTKQQLAEIGVKIGADVPYCIYGGTCLSEGIGEILTPVPNQLQCFVVIAKPEFSVSTKFVYENLHVERIERHPDIDGMLNAIHRGSLPEVADKMENILENVTAKKYPQIEEMKECLMANGAMKALMSGSGPTVFGIFDKEDVAEKAFEELKKTGLVSQGTVTTFADCTGIME